MKKPTKKAVKATPAPTAKLVGKLVPVNSVPSCPECKERVLRVDEMPSTRVYVHQIGGAKDNPVVYGCAVSTVGRRR